MLLGYARVSTGEQNLETQRKALTAHGCQRIYAEKISGAKRDRPALARLLDNLRSKDIVIVTRLDRLARSTLDLLEIAKILSNAHAGLRSIGEPWADTTSPSGKMILTVFAGIAEFERALITERTKNGRITARQNGVRFGRPPRLNPEQVKHAKKLLKDGSSLREAARILGCHHATLHRTVARI
jgi:DNA invertase Pin-like site-specific DNA recombinase